MKIIVPNFPYTNSRFLPRTEIKKIKPGTRLLTQLVNVWFSLQPTIFYCFVLFFATKQVEKRCFLLSKSAAKIRRL